MDLWLSESLGPVKKDLLTVALGHMMSILSPEEGVEVYTVLQFHPWKGEDNGSSVFWLLWGCSGLINIQSLGQGPALSRLRICEM